jgi:hypothetical protein
MKKSGKSLAGAVISAIVTIRVVILIFMAVLVFFVRFPPALLAILVLGLVFSVESVIDCENHCEQAISLNPLNDRGALRTSILKLEDDNYDDPGTREQQRQLYCLAISAKRYALFLRDKRDSPVLLRKGANNNEDRWSEHGLGHLLNPTDPESDDREMDRASVAWLDSQLKGQADAETSV